MPAALRRTVLAWLQFRSEIISPLLAILQVENAAIFIGVTRQAHAVVMVSDPIGRNMRFVGSRFAAFGLFGIMFMLQKSMLLLWEDNETLAARVRGRHEGRGRGKPAAPPAVA